MLFKLFARKARQKSTYSGLNVLVAILGIYFGPAEVDAIVALVSAAYGAYDILRNEGEDVTPAKRAE